MDFPASTTPYGEITVDKGGQIWVKWPDMDIESLDLNEKKNNFIQMIKFEIAFWRKRKTKYDANISSIASDKNPQAQ